MKVVIMAATEANTVVAMDTVVATEAVTDTDTRDTNTAIMGTMPDIIMNGVIMTKESMVVMVDMNMADMEVQHIIYNIYVINFEYLS